MQRAPLARRWSEPSQGSVCPSPAAFPLPGRRSRGYGVRSNLAVPVTMHWKDGRNHYMQVTERTCPRCGKAISVDERFAVWCEHCEWGLEPADKPESQRERQRQHEAKARGERLFAELKNAPVSKPTLSGDGIAAFAIAIAVHAITIGVFVLGLYVLVTNFPSFFGFFVGGLLILVG